MTKPPCYTKEHGDCKRRCVGCKASCEDWREWQTIHEQEKAVIQRNKAADHEINKFMIEQGKRIEASYKRDHATRYRRQHK